VKKIIVASFQRSGTHFLINSLATNCLEVEDGWVDLIHSRANRWVCDVHQGNLTDKIYEQLCVYRRNPMRRCIKTHYQMYFIEPCLDAILENYDILYIVRDPRDTMVACFYYYNNTNYESFIKQTNFSLFLRTQLWNVRTETQPYSYSYVKPTNIVDKWSKHVLSWMRYRDQGVVFVKYSHLNGRFEETLRYIESQTSQQLRSVISPVTLADPRYRPDFDLPGSKRGQVGIWKEYFSIDDLRFLHQTLSIETKEFLDTI
jgi:hypothetical protein